MRRRADWTVAHLARELSVSRRTVLRDSGALREAGFVLDTFSRPGGGSAAGARHALAKIEQALLAARVTQLRALRKRILVGEPRPTATPTAIDANLVDAFETAFTTTRPHNFTYHDHHGRGTSRQVEPHGLLVRPPLWYVIAWTPAATHPGSSAPTGSAPQPSATAPSVPGQPNSSPVSAPTPDPLQRAPSVLRRNFVG